MTKKVAVIGSGFSSLSASCYLAKAGYEVSIFEKNASLGGRCRQLQKEGFTFDIGPSWYWMPDIFEKFFKDFNKTTSDYYSLEKLDPAYKIFFKQDAITIGDTRFVQSLSVLKKEVPSICVNLLNRPAKNYEIAIDTIVWRPGISPLELVTIATITRLDQFIKTISGEVRKKFKNPKLISALEFPVLFLGAKPSQTPSFYNFMNFADFGLGTWHPKGGMYEIIKAMSSLAIELGVSIHLNTPVEKINVEDGKAIGVTLNETLVKHDIVLSGADYHHSETLLDQKFRQYSEQYWKSRIFAPSSLLFYVGFDKKLTNVEHHNLFFDTDFELHAKEIYDEPKWPSKPLFYANFPSVTDETMAPEGCETGFFLIPLAPGLEDSPELREAYFDRILLRFENLTQQKSLKNNINFKESFCIEDFKSEYNSYKGNAYGMANTLRQTAFLRPKLKSKKVKNLFFYRSINRSGTWSTPCPDFRETSCYFNRETHSPMKTIFDNVSYKCSQLVTESYSTSFSLATKMLGTSIRSDIYNIYGFVRFADEIVDTFHDFDKEFLFEKFEISLDDAIIHKISLNPILNSFQHTFHKYQIPRHLVDSFMKSMKMDLYKNVYRTEEEYKEYIYGSADVVGLMCLQVFVKGDTQVYDALKSSAMSLGSAFQKINFLRDIKADYEGLNRSYFPNTNLMELSEAAKNNIVSEIKEDLSQGFKGIELLPNEAKFGVYTAYMYYKKLLTKLQNTPPLELKNARIRVPNYQKFGLLAKSYVNYKLKLI